MDVFLVIYIISAGKTSKQFIFVEKCLSCATKASKERTPIQWTERKGKKKFNLSIGQQLG
jgi:hypothetical protein